MLQELRERLGGKRTVVLGIGNTLRGDDGIGPRLAERLQGRTDALVLDGGDVPEDYLGPIVKARPQAVVIVDAVEMSASAGDIALIEVEALVGGGFSTHSPGLGLFVRALCSRVQPDVFVLGVQPAVRTFGSDLSQAACGALDVLERMLLGVLAASARVR